MDFIDSLILEHIKDIGEDTQTGETGSVKNLSTVSCTLTPTWSWNNVWRCTYEAGLLPWDIEMTVEETVSDDDDGPPHRVSDSESESEAEQDSDYFFV